jgi:hypothetical protein
VECARTTDEGQSKWGTYATACTSQQEGGAEGAAAPSRIFLEGAMPPQNLILIF